MQCNIDGIFSYKLSSIWFTGATTDGNTAFINNEIVTIHKTDSRNFETLSKELLKEIDKEKFRGIVFNTSKLKKFFMRSGSTTSVNRKHSIILKV